MKFSIIAAADKKFGIGKNNSLPWRLKGDLEYFSQVTTEAAAGKMNAVIMGRNTWYSLPDKHRPLSGRINVVLSRAEVRLPEGVIWASSFEDAFNKLSKRSDTGEIFIVGGANIYAQAIVRSECEKVYLTEVEGEFDCDTFFPALPDEFKKTGESERHVENGIGYKFAVYEKLPG
jgi:dihydrofolate reductase